MNTSNIAIKDTLGNFIHNVAPSQEYLILSFSPGSISLSQRWRNNCLSANFLADYLSTFFSGQEEETSFDKQTEVQSAVSYIANELLENAMKYGVETSPFPVSIRVHLKNNLMIFQLTNSILTQQTPAFQSYLEDLLSADPQEQYIAQLEKNALEENNAESGLGLLTMLNDYDAKLGWKFERLSQQPSEIAVTTMVQLEI